MDFAGANELAVLITLLECHLKLVKVNFDLLRGGFSFIITTFFLLLSARAST